MNTQQTAALTLTGGLFVGAAGSLYGYLNRGKGKGNAQARERAAMLQAAGAAGTAIGTGILLWPVIRSRFNNQPQGGDGTQVETTESQSPWLPGGGVNPAVSAQAGV